MSATDPACFKRRPGQNCYCDLPKGHKGLHVCLVCNVEWGRAVLTGGET